MLIGAADKIWTIQESREVSSLGGVVNMNVDVAQNDYFAWVGWVGLKEEFGLGGSEEKQGYHEARLQTFKCPMFKETFSMF